MGYVSHSRQRRQVSFIVSQIAYSTLLIPRSLRCIQVIAGVLGRAGEAGQKRRLAQAAKGNITYRPASNLVIPETSEGEGLLEKIRAAASEDIMDTDEASDKLDDVNNHEDHRLKGGRDIKASS